MFINFYKTKIKSLIKSKGYSDEWAEQYIKEFGVATEITKKVEFENLIQSNKKLSDKAKELILSQDFDEFETHADTSAKKSSRKLPKFMLRETPKDQNGYIYENFRIFLKWTLELLANNSKITSLGEIDTVYVNMPKEFGFLFDMINAEANENKVKFVPLNNDASNSPSFLSALELFGGFQVEQYNKINNF